MFKCWACSETNDTHGSLYKLIKNYGNKNDLKQYKLINPEPIKDKQVKEKVVLKGLPKEFIPLSLEDSSQDYKLAMDYLVKRNIRFRYIREGFYGANQLLLESR